MKNTWYILGLMSGTSLDGVDIALCRFEHEDHSDWRYEIIEAECYEYDSIWKQKLSDAHILRGLDLMLLHNEYGIYLGERVKTFMNLNPLKPELIASHGHTVFHQPHKNLSFQLGNGATIYAATGIPVVSDFRSVDVCLGGQGAPLVPVGDALLFREYEYCLNLGGISNISCDKDGQRIAYDICGCNLLLNSIASEIGLDYDDKGEIARRGKLHDGLLAALNEWGYYKTLPPKSLDKETMLSELMPIINSYPVNIEDKLATVADHIATQISKAMVKTNGSVLVTGGGVLNENLIRKIHEKASLNVVIPSEKLIHFKEALIFAFLGLLRVQNKKNTLSSVTGAQRDSIGGALFGDYHPGF